MFSFFWPAPVVNEDPKALLQDIRTFSAQQSVYPVELRQALESFFKKFMLNDLEVYDRSKIIDAVLTQHAWPQSDTREFVAKNNDVAKVKAELLEAMGMIGEVNLKINSLLQSLCKNTFLGSIFHYARRYTATSVEKGSLKEIAIQLEQLILQLNDQSSYELLDDTKIALQKEVERNPDLHTSLIKYPNLQLLLSNVAPLSARISLK